METKRIQISESECIRFIDNDDTTQFILIDIYTILGYKNPGNAIYNLRTVNRKKIKIKHENGKISNTWIADLNSVRTIIQSSRSIHQQKLLDGLAHFNINMNVISRCVEADWISILFLGFRKFNPQLQYHVDKYKIDLYFPDYQIAIECDENDHRSKSMINELERQKYIEQKVGAYFIRFNPDAHDFNIGYTIDTIVSVLLHRESKPYLNKVVSEKEYTEPTRALRNINLDPEKPCTKCLIVKPLEEFNKASDHRDGRENVCIPCRRARQAVILEEAKEKNGCITEIECNRCEVTLDVVKFFKDKRSPTGYMRRCKECHKSRIKKLGDEPKIIVTEKICKTCSVLKPIGEYHKRKCSKDGYNIYCKECACEKAKILAQKKKG